MIDYMSIFERVKPKINIERITIIFPLSLDKEIFENRFSKTNKSPFKLPNIIWKQKT